MTLDDSTAESLPPQLRSLLQTWGIRGTVSADARWRRSSSQPLDSSIDVDLAGIRIHHRSFPVDLRILTGRATIRGTELTLSNVRAEGEGIELRVDGTVTTNDNTLTAELRIDGALAEFTEAIRQAAPWRIRKLLGNLQPAGSLRLRGGTLRFNQTTNTAADDWNWNFDGSLEANDLSVQAGMPIENLSGAIQFRASGTRGVISFDGQINAPQVTIGGIKLNEVTGNAAYDSAKNQWLLADLQGQMADSVLTGELKTSVNAGETNYTAAVSFLDVPVNSLVPALATDDGATDDGQEEHKHIAGTATGQIYMDGAFGDTSHRRVGGSFRVRDAELYKLPPLLAILNVINLTLPKESAFQSIDTEFFLLGDDLQFRNLRLQGNALAMVGEGKMKWSSKDIDLKLTAVSPREATEIPVVTELLEGAAREIIEVRVTGTMSKPVASARPFRTVSNALDTLLHPRKKPTRKVQK